MAASTKPTTLGYAEIAKRIAGAASTAMKSIVGLTGACTASEASTFANPGGATKLAANGFSLADADTVAVSTTTATDDTCELDHVFTFLGNTGVTFNYEAAFSLNLPVLNSWLDLRARVDFPYFYIFNVGRQLN